MKFPIPTWALLIILLPTCSGPDRIRLTDSDESPDTDQTPETQPDPTENTSCPSYDSGEVLARIESGEIVEASGLVVSRKNPGVIWIHNDSGDSPRFFAVDMDGSLLATYQLSGATNRDWEDISIGPGPAAGESYLYLGDIGSSAEMPRTIYRVEEPDVPSSPAATTITLSDYDTIKLTFPNDKSPNAETLLVDSETGDLYLVTKTGGVSEVFYKKGPHSDGEVATVTRVASINFESLPGNRQATGGDINPAGTLIAIRTYSHAFVWQKTADQTLGDSLSGAPCATIELIEEPQGEAIGFDTNDRDLLTTSESTNQPIYRYRGGAF